MTNKTFRQTTMTILFAICAVLFSAAAASAATYTVTTTADNGAGSLRAAIDSANAPGSGPDTVQFAIPASDPNCPAGICTITLTSGELAVDSAATAGTLTITNSTGASNLLVSGDIASRVFYLKSGANLTINGITITKGSSEGTVDPGYGGGIYNNGGTLTLTNSTVSGNEADGYGGGIYNNGGTLTLTNSTVSDNLGGIYGGGIFVGGTTTLTNSTVSGNTTLLVGGGGILNVGTLTMTNSTVSGNTVDSTSGSGSNGGGGILNFGTLIMTNSIVSDNTMIVRTTDGGGYGGGIYSESGTLTLTNSTVSGNVARISGGGGGGIYSRNSSTTLTGSTVSGNTSTDNGGGFLLLGSGTTTLTNSTVSGNTAFNGGGFAGFGPTLNLTSVTVTQNRSNDSFCTDCAGGIYNSATANLKNTIVAGNRVANASSSPDFYGIVAAGSAYNLLGSGQGMSGITNGDANRNQVGVDAKLAALANNGGTTQTHALLFGSPAIDKGNSFTLTTDQRGSTRPVDLASYPNAAGSNGADIGAFESQTPPLAGISINNVMQNEGNSGTSTFTFTVSLSSPAPTGGVTFNIATANDTATAGSDYVARTLIGQTIAAGNSTYTFNVTVNGDTTVEGNETFFVNVTNVTGAAPISVQGTGTITNDDLAPQNFVVNSTNDPGDGACNVAECTLREAIAAANSVDTIQFSALFDSPQTITLTAGELSINKNLTITGKGANLTTISGNNTSRVFLIDTGINAAINGITITNGNADFGGGLRSFGNLTVNNATIRNNTAGNGGGGIQVQGGSTTTFNNSTISNNSSANTGGGIDSFGSVSITLNNSTISGNTATNSSGGLANTGTLTATNSTISNNSSPFGGGIGNFGTAALNSSTVSNNSATTSGGGLRNANNGTTTLNNTIIANSTSGGDCVRESGAINATYSLIEGGLTCVNGTNTNNLTGDPNLDALADNGGTTKTHALLPGSIAIDKGNSTLTTDQRGSTRPVDLMTYSNATGGNGADIGAFEVQFAPTAASASISGRVLTDGGRGLANAIVYLTDTNGNTRSARTTAFGYYRFDDVEAGQTVVMTVASKRYQFTPQVVNVTDSLSEINFIGESRSRVPIQSGEPKAEQP